MRVLYDKGQGPDPNSRFVLVRGGSFIYGLGCRASIPGTRDLYLGLLPRIKIKRLG